MPSSKFSLPKRFYKLPVICRPIPGRSPYVCYPTYPLMIRADAHVADYDPPIIFNFARSFEIVRTPPAFTYSGRSAGIYEYVFIDATPNMVNDIWRIVLTIWAPHNPGEVFTYLRHIAPDTSALDSRTIFDINIPGKDFRIIRLHL